MKLLLIEDDPRIGDMLVRGLSEEGYEVTLSPDGEEGEYLARVHAYDLVILDWMLPGRSGPEILRAWREEGIAVPVLMLTALGEVADKVTGFRSGADDYLPKPFSFDELIVRLEALHRRSLGAAGRTLREGDLLIDLDNQTVTCNDQPLSLTQKEYELLRFLIAHKNQTVSPEMIRDRLWGDVEYIESNVIQVTVYHLRQKIGKEKIATQRGVGYRYETA